MLGNYSFCSKKNGLNLFGNNSQLNFTQQVQRTPNVKNAKKTTSNINVFNTPGKQVIKSSVVEGQGFDSNSVNSDLQSISSPFVTDNESIGSDNSNLSNGIPKPILPDIQNGANENINKSGFSTPKKSPSISSITPNTPVSNKKNINGSPNSPKVVDIIQKEFLFGDQEIFNRVKYFYSKNRGSTLLKSLCDAYERGFKSHCNYVDEELNPTPTKVQGRRVLGKDGTPKKVKAHVAQKLPNEFYTKKNSEELIEEWNQHGLKSMMTELQSIARKIQDIIREYEKTENNSDTIVDLAILGLLGVNYLFKDYNGFSILQYAGNQARCYLFPFAISMAQLQFPEVSVYNELNFARLSESAQKLYRSMSKPNSILEKYSNVLFRSNKSIDHFGEAGLIKTLQDNGHANGRKFFGILKNIFEIAKKSNVDIDDGLLSEFNIDEQIELLSERTGGFDLCIQNTNDQLMNQIKLLQQELDSKNKLLSEIQKQIDSFKSRANEALNQVTSLEENNIELQKELKTLTEKNNQIIQENEELKIQMKSQIDEIRSQAESQINQSKEEISKLKKSYRQQISQINNELENSKAQNTKLISKTKDLETQIQGFQQKNENIFSENQRLNTQVENLNNNLQSKDQELQTKTQELNFLTKKNNQMIQENDQLKIQTEAQINEARSKAETEINKVRNQAKKLQNQNEQLKAQSTTQINQVKEEILKLQEVHSQQISKVNNELENSKTQNQQLINKAKDLQTQNEQLNSDILSKENLNSELQNNVKSLNKELDGIKELLIIKDEELQTKAQELNFLAEQIELANQKNIELSNSLSEKGNEINQVKNQAKAALLKLQNDYNQQISQISQALKNSESQKQQLINESTELRAQAQRIQQQNESISSENQNLKAELVNARSLIQENKSELSTQKQNLTDQLNQVSNDKDRLQNNIRRLNDENQSLTQQLTQVRNEKDGLQNNIQRLNDENQDLNQQFRDLQESNRAEEEKNSLLKKYVIAGVTSVAVGMISYIVYQFISKRSLASQLANIANENADLLNRINILENAPKVIETITETVTQKVVETRSSFGGFLKGIVIGTATFFAGAKFGLLKSIGIKG